MRGYWVPLPSPQHMPIPNTIPGAVIVAFLLLVGCDRGPTAPDATQSAPPPVEEPRMIKLYKKEDKRWQYHEAWIGDGAIMEHWGIVGERGATREHPLASGGSPTAALRKVLQTAYDRGYGEVPLDEHAILLVEYAVDGFGTPEDLDRRHRLEERLGETLGWTGLGHCDGGSIGSGTMEAACFVIDFEVAKAVVAKDLQGTEFANFTRIFDERNTKD